MIRKREFLWAAVAAALVAWYVTRPKNLAVRSSAMCAGKCPGNNGYVDWQ